MVITHKFTSIFDDLHISKPKTVYKLFLACHLHVNMIAKTKMSIDY